MKLSTLIKNQKDIIATRGDLEIDILQLSQKADKKTQNGLFFCINGIAFDGHDFFQNAINNGCIALVVEKWLDTPQPQILVQNVRNFVPVLCKRFYKNVQNKLKFIGVTGTNGKTTTANLVYQILKNDNKKVGIIGTNGIEFEGVNLPNPMTTPDPIDLFDILSEMVKKSVEYVVMEVSAHALFLRKLAGIRFEVGIFTNFSQDHLDFFKNMDNYAQAKQLFFDKSMCKNVVINIDDELGRTISRKTNSKLFTYGIFSPATNFAMDVVLKDDGTDFLLNIFDNVFDIKSNMLCLFNVYNMLASAVCAKILGLSNESIFKTLSNVKKIDGRMNFYKLQSGATAVIDYAHTPDSLKKALLNLKDFTQNRLLVVFGCGGNRDSDKRKKMGEVTSLLADFTIITSDNPRNESPKKIISQIKSGFDDKEKYTVIVDRKQAIVSALRGAEKGDIVLIAGKGHEKMQEIKGIKYPFDDYEIIKPFIKL